MAAAHTEACESQGFVEGRLKSGCAGLGLVWTRLTWLTRGVASRTRHPPTRGTTLSHSVMIG